MKQTTLLKWFPGIKEAFEEAIEISNASFKIRTEFAEFDDIESFNQVEQGLIKEAFQDGWTSGCIAEFVVSEEDPLSPENYLFVNWKIKK